jgi:hypothetical protein
MLLANGIRDTQQVGEEEPESPPAKLCVEDYHTEKERLQGALRHLPERCSHKYRDGSKATVPCGDDGLAGARVDYDVLCARVVPDVLDDYLIALDSIWVQGDGYGATKRRVDQVLVDVVPGRCVRRDDGRLKRRADDPIATHVEPMVAQFRW